MFKCMTTPFLNCRNEVWVRSLIIDANQIAHVLFLELGKDLPSPKHNSSYAMLCAEVSYQLIY